MCDGDLGKDIAVDHVVSRGVNYRDLYVRVCRDNIHLGTGLGCPCAVRHVLGADCILHRGATDQARVSVPAEAKPRPLRANNDSTALIAGPG